MKLTCGFMQIDTSTLFSKNKQLKFSGQICVDGIETFLVREPRDGTPRRYFPYYKREHVYEQVLKHFGEDLHSLIDDLVVEKSIQIKADKKYLAKLRKSDRYQSKSKK